MTVQYQALKDRIKFLEEALCDIYDVAVPEAMTWMNSHSEKATYAARTLDSQISGRYRLAEGAQKILESYRTQLETARKALDRIAFGLGADGSVIEAKAALALINAGQKGGK